MLLKGFYPYEHMSSWQRFNQTSLGDKKKFDSNLTMENVTDADYKHVCRVLKDFRVQKIYHDIYLQSDRLLLADAFESFLNKCIEIYEFDPAYIFRTKISIVAMPKEKRIKNGTF